MSARYMFTHNDMCITIQRNIPVNCLYKRQSGEKRAASTFKLCIHNLDNSNMIKLLRQPFLNNFI